MLCTCGASKVGSPFHYDWCDSNEPKNAFTMIRGFLKEGTEGIFLYVTRELPLPVFKNIMGDTDLVYVIDTPEVARGQTKAGTQLWVVNGEALDSMVIGTVQGSFVENSANYFDDYGIAFYWTQGTVYKVNPITKAIE